MIKAYWFENEIWKAGNLEEFIDGRVISLVGGGGKTSTMRYLAGKYQSRGEKTIVMTTTKISYPQILCQTPEECIEQWEAGKYAICGQRFSDIKIKEPSAEMTKWIFSNADRILIEADGSRQLPCKVPGAHEPVLMNETDLVIGVMGIDALGKPVEQICFRPELVCEQLSCSMNHLLTAQDMAKILLSEMGTRKLVNDKKYVIIINKCDDEELLMLAQNVVEELARMGHRDVILTTHRP